MLAKYIKRRVYVFIDAENLFYAQTTLGWRVSYEKLMRYLWKECGRDVRCFVYTGVDEDNTKQQKFLDMLDINGYIVRTKLVKKIRTAGNHFQWKGNLDIELALEMVELKDKYATAILVSGDSDFAIVLDKLKASGKRVIVISTRGRVARELLERAKYIDLRKLRREVGQQKV